MLKNNNSRRKSKAWASKIKKMHKKVGPGTKIYHKNGRGRRGTGRSSAHNMSQFTNQ